MAATQAMTSNRIRDFNAQVDQEEEFKPFIGYVLQRTQLVNETASDSSISIGYK